MDRDRAVYVEGTGNLYWTAINAETRWAGGKPSKQTPADKRLKENRPAQAPKPPQPRKGK